MSRHLYVSCDRCGVMARYGIAQHIWRLHNVDLCPPCDEHHQAQLKEEAPK